MISRVLLCFLLLPLITWAATDEARIDLAGVKVSELVSLYYSEFDKRAFVLCPELITDARQVTLRGQGRELRALLRSVLAQSDWVERENDGVITVCSRESWRKVDLAKGAEPFVYRPRYRSVKYLERQAGGVVSGRFATSSTGGGLPAVASEAGAMPAVGLTSNSDVLVFHGVSAEVALLKSLLRELDIPLPQVTVKALIYEVGKTSDVQSTLNVVGQLLGGRVAVDLGVGAAGASARISIGGLDAVAGLLDQDSRFKVVSRPQMLVSSGSDGVLLVGQNVPTLGAIAQNATGTSQSVTYRDSGVTLKVTPEVLRDSVRLAVSQEVSDFVKTTSGVNGSPTLNKRQFSSTFSLGVGQVGMIAGLQSTKRTSTAQRLFGFALDDAGADSDAQLLLFLSVEAFSETDDKVTTAPGEQWRTLANDLL